MTKVVTTASGIPLAPVYQLQDREGSPDNSLPGEFPYTRGIQAEMYRGRLWSIRQYAGYGDATDANRRFRYLLDQGQTGLSVAFDLPTQMGLDSDDPRAAGEVGQVGVAIDSLHDMEALFAEIPLNQVSTSMTINAPAVVLVAMYIVAAEKQGFAAQEIMGTVQNDILKEYVARGTYIYPPRPSLRLAADLIAYCAKTCPKFNPISVSGYHIREAGSTAPQEMAFALANALAYVDEVTAMGVDIDDFAPRISWIFNTHSDFFEEIAKYRALRRLWATLMQARGAKNPRSQMLRTHTQTGGSTLTAQQPENNIVRAALQALAAVLGGVQSLALSCYDEALALPTEEAQHIAVRTQQILATETGVASTADPLGGSYFLEWLTDQLAQKAEQILEEIAGQGGAVACIESGWMQSRIAEEAYHSEQAVRSGEKVIVGVNRYANASEEANPKPIFRPNPEYARLQARKLQGYRQDRDQKAVQQTLLDLREAALANAPLTPAVVEAVRSYATLGEICNQLREIYGEYHPPAAV